MRSNRVLFGSAGSIESWPPPLEDVVPALEALESVEIPWMDSEHRISYNMVLTVHELAARKPCKQFKQ